jgi:hypothetical protein
MIAIEEFIEVVSSDQFVEGHEVLEGEWHRLKKLPEYEDEAKILKGLINASTALALASKGKKEGALKVWQTYEKYAPLIQVTLSLAKPRYEEAQILLLTKKNLYM